MKVYDVIILGAGAAGLFCAAHIARGGQRKSSLREQSSRGQLSRGQSSQKISSYPSVLVLDHAKKLGEKIRISGGGRCNFTNLKASPAYYLSDNLSFCKAALQGYRPEAFVALVKSYGIGIVEKEAGQLFCREKAQQIVDLLHTECEKSRVQIKAGTKLHSVEKKTFFEVQTDQGKFLCRHLVVATGGKSIPKIGASGFGYTIAKNFGHSLIPIRAGLVPLTFEESFLEKSKNLTGVSFKAKLSLGKVSAGSSKENSSQKKQENRPSFEDGFLFTHRGISGPSVLQISSYWTEGQSLEVDFLPQTPLLDLLLSEKDTKAKQQITTVLSQYLPKKFVSFWTEEQRVDGKMAEISKKNLTRLAQSIKNWQVSPVGTEGYRTAEVTLGGVNTQEVSAQTMESQLVSGLYFIGEVLDVTGHLGGYNFQWAWASGFAAAQGIAESIEN